MWIWLVWLIRWMGRWVVIWLLEVRSRSLKLMWGIERDGLVVLGKMWSGRKRITLWNTDELLL
jgi:hypothetical protein